MISLFSWLFTKYGRYAMTSGLILLLITSGFLWYAVTVRPDIAELMNSAILWSVFTVVLAAMVSTMWYRAYHGHPSE